jgi:hypothetical protein
MDFAWLAHVLLSRVSNHEKRPAILFDPKHDSFKSWSLGNCQ